MSDPVHLISGCGSLEEFFAAFRRYADRQGLFVPTAAPLPLGRRAQVRLTLRDGGVVLAGEVEVASSSPRPAGLHGRAGMLLRFVAPDAPTQELLAHLERLKLSPGATPPPAAVRPGALPAGALPPSAPSSAGVAEPVQALAECAVFGAPVEPVVAPGRFAIPSIPSPGRPGASSAPLPGMGPARPAAPLPSPAALFKPAVPAPVAPPPVAPAPVAPAPVAPATMAADSNVDSRKTMMGFPALVAPAAPSGAAIPIAPAPAALPVAPAPAPRPATAPVVEAPRPATAPVVEPLRPATAPVVEAPRPATAPPVAAMSTPRPPTAPPSAPTAAMPTAEAAAPPWSAPLPPASDDQDVDFDDAPPAPPTASPWPSTLPLDAPFVGAPLPGTEPPDAPFYAASAAAPPAHAPTPAANPGLAQTLMAAPAVQLPAGFVPAWQAPAAPPEPMGTGPAPDWAAAPAPAWPPDGAAPVAAVPVATLPSVPHAHAPAMPALGVITEVAPSGGASRWVWIFGLLGLAVAGGVVAFLLSRPKAAAPPVVAAGSAEVGSAAAGSAEAGSAAAGSAETGSAAAGSAETGSAALAPTPDAAPAVLAVVDAAPAAVAVVDAAPPRPPVDAAPTTTPPTTTTCAVKFTSAPPGASVTVGGRDLGSTPFKVDLPCASARATFRKSKYEATTKSVRPTPKGVTVHAVLERPMVSIKVSSVPSGATISVGGAAKGKTPGVIKIPAHTATTITVTRDGFAPLSKKVTTGADDPGPAHFPLKKK